MFTAAADADLLRDIQELRQLVMALQPPGRLRLQTLQPDPLLGQPVLLTVSATDLTGQPLIDVPLTLVTTWGTLRTTHELVSQQSNSLTTRTNAQGQATLQLRPPTSEDLIDAQQEALETFLSLLNSQADTPQETQDSLREMVKLYSWDANLAYRQAIDIYFRDFGQGLLESVNAYDYLQDWSYQNATVIAFLQPQAADGNSTTQVTTTLTVQFKNWLGPWLETYLAVTQSESNLGDSFGIIKERGDASSIVEGVYDRLQQFIENQQGIVGQYINRKVAETTVNEFLTTGIEALDLDARVALTPSLSVASKTLQTVGVSGLAGIAQTRSELTQVVTNTVGQATTAIAGLTEQVGTIATQVGSAQTSIGNLQSSFTGLESSVGTISGRVGALDSRVVTIGDRVGALDSRVGVLDGRVITIGDRVGALDSRVGTIDGRVGTIDGRVGTLDNRVGTIDGRVGTIATQLNTLNTSVTDVGGRLGSLTTRFDTLNTNITDVNGRLGSLSTRFDELQTRNRDITTSLGQLSDRLSSVQQASTTLTTQVGTLSGRLDGLQRDQGTLSNRVDVVQRDQTALVTRVDGLQRNQTAFDTNLGTLTTRLNGLQQTTTTLDGRVGTLTTQVGGLQTNIGRLNDQIGGLQTRFTAVDNQIGGLQTRFTAVDNQIGGLQTRFTAVDNQIGGLQTRVGTLDTNVIGLQGNFDRFSRASAGRLLQLEDSITRVGNNTLSIRTDLINRPGG